MSPDAPDCPRCWIHLDPVLLTGGDRDVEAHVCPECKGLYLHAGEVARVTGHDRLGPLLVDYLDFDYDSLLICPGCGNQMEEKQAAGVEVDTCMACHGVWLDHGELTRLARADPDAFAVRDDHDDLPLDDRTREQIRDVARSLQSALGRIRDRLKAIAPGSR